MVQRGQPPTPPKCGTHVRLQGPEAWTSGVLGEGGGPNGISLYSRAKGSVEGRAQEQWQAEVEVGSAGRAGARRGESQHACSCHC